MWIETETGKRADPELERQLDQDFPDARLVAAPWTSYGIAGAFKKLTSLGGDEMAPKKHRDEIRYMQVDR
jgi:hypothetical protein